ncbi:MAG: hypothetical protein AAFR14_00105 [Bacteroidota bacterium]
MWEERLVGQKPLLTSLRKSLVEDKLPHAMIVAGRYGYGGLAISLALAQTILCTDLKNGRPCGVCKACVQSSKLIHPDLHMSYPVVAAKGGKPKRDQITSDYYVTQWRQAISETPYLNHSEWIEQIVSESSNSDINVTECVNIYQKLSMTSYSGSRRVLIMWHAEKLGSNGNRLLKLIEEPPVGTFIIFVVEQPELLLNTIRSRCQLIDVKRIATEDITDYGRQTLDLDTEGVDRISFMAEGDLRQVQELVGMDHADISTITEQWIDAIFAGQLAKTRAVVDAYKGKTKIDVYRSSVAYFLRLLRELIHLRVAGEGLTRLSDVDRVYLQRHRGLQALDIDQIGQISEKLSATLDMLYHNVNARNLAFHVSLQIEEIIIRK